MSKLKPKSKMAQSDRNEDFDGDPINRSNTIAPRRTVFQNSQMPSSAKQPLYSIVKSNASSSNMSQKAGEADEALDKIDQVDVLERLDKLGFNMKPISTRLKRNASVETLSLNSLRIICAHTGSIKWPAGERTGYDIADLYNMKLSSRKKRANKSKEPVSHTQSMFRLPEI